MRTFLEAVQGVAEIVDILFYVPEGTDISQDSVTKIQENLGKSWSINANVTFSSMLCNLKPSRMEYYLLPVTSFFNHLGYRDVSGIEQVAAFEKCLERNPDAIFIHRLSSVCPALLTRKKLPPVFFDLDDIEHVTFFRSNRQPPFWFGKLFYYLQMPSLMLGERRAIHLAKKTFVCSDLDCVYLSRLYKNSHVVTIPNSVDIPEIEPGYGHTKKMLFIGTYTYGPNIAAAEFLIDIIWPIVKRSVPDARLLIVGKKPENISSFKARPEGVEFSGFLTTLGEAYKNTQVVCCPVLTGGGTRLKIIEAASYGKTIVSTRLGAEGLDFKDGYEIILRDGEIDFANACIEFLRNPSKCREIGKRAREKTIAAYDRGQIIHAISRQLTG